MAYMHVAEVASPPRPRAPWGCCSRADGVFMVTDYPLEWSYPEVSCRCRHHPHLPYLPTCFTCQPPHLPHLSHLPHHLPTCQHAARDACLHVAALLEVLGGADQVPSSVPMAEIPPPLPGSQRGAGVSSEARCSACGARISACCHLCHLADVLRFHPCFALSFGKDLRAAGKHLKIHRHHHRPSVSIASDLFHKTKIPIKLRGGYSF